MTTEQTASRIFKDNVLKDLRSTIDRMKSICNDLKVGGHRKEAQTSTRIIGEMENLCTKVERMTG